MTDQRVQELERRYATTGAREDELALHAQVRRAGLCADYGLSPPEEEHPDIGGDYSDWLQAFGYVGEPNTCATEYQDAKGRPRWAGSGPLDPDAEPVTRKDVKKILALSEGENNELSWLGVFDLWDGRYLFLEAGCDYTGWD